MGLLHLGLPTAFPHAYSIGCSRTLPSSTRIEGRLGSCPTSSAAAREHIPLRYNCQADHILTDNSQPNLDNHRLHRRTLPTLSVDCFLRAANRHWRHVSKN